MNRATIGGLALALVLHLSGGVAIAQAPATVTPQQGQTAEQVAADQAACESQAMASSGYNPAATAAAPQAAPVMGQRARGAARGAAAGAVREQRTDSSEREVDDLTESAARAGAVAGGMRQRGERREQRRHTQQAEAATASQQSAYFQAFGACMTAKGYSVR
ncbi:MAG TPA: hypothetical protein P5558_05255 [Geminicoccaceae bacterium]|jgi:hypothetical protein|nr:hypothetical protein [Geminicoccaceae bacterium]